MRREGGKIEQKTGENFIQVLDESDEFDYNSDDYQLIRANFMHENIDDYEVEQAFAALPMMTQYKILLVILTTLSRTFGKMDGDDQRLVNWYNLGSCNGVDMEAWKTWQRNR